MATFVDTTAWAAVKNRKDRNYLAAVEVFTDLAERRERVVTTDFVLAMNYNHEPPRIELVLASVDSLADEVVQNIVSAQR